jgi:hypothetical protein
MDVPRAQKSKTETFLPNRPRLRREKELPHWISRKTLALIPTLTVPQMLTALPKRAKFLRLTLEPNATYSSTLAAAPNLLALRTERELPRWICPITETLKQDPTTVFPKTEEPEPTLQN